MISANFSKSPFEVSSLGGTVIADGVKKQAKQLETIVYVEFCIKPAQVRPHSRRADPQIRCSRVILMAIT